MNADEIAALRAGLGDDVVALKVQVARLQVQIAKCEAAMVELDVIARHPTSPAPVAGIPATAPSAPPAPAEPTVPDMLRQLLSGGAFNPPRRFAKYELRDALVAANPLYAHKCRTGVYPAIHQLVLKKVLLEFAGGSLELWIENLRKP